MPADDFRRLNYQGLREKNPRNNEYDKLWPNMLLILDQSYIFIILNKYIVSLCITVYDS